MNHTLMTKIIAAVEKDVEKFNSCSIKQAALSVFYNNITLSEQKKLAKLIVKKNHFITEVKNGEIIVMKNLLYVQSKNDTVERYEFLKYVMWVIVSMVAYLVFDVFLPTLSK